MRVSRSLTIKQMAMVASVSMAFVLVFCTILLFHFVQQSRFTTATQLESIARSVREPLSAAILKADIPEAEAILSRIQPAGIVSRADVVLPNQFQALRMRFIPERPVPVTVTRLFELPVQISLPIYSLERPANPQPLAYLVLQADSYRMYKFVMSALATLVTAYLLLVLMLTVALTWCINRLMVRPLRRIARELNDLSQQERLGHQLTLPRLHHDDEIGMLVRSYNRNQQSLVRQHDELSIQSTRFPVSELPNKAFLLAMLEQTVARPQSAALIVVACETLQDAAGVLKESQREMLLLTLVEKLRAAIPPQMVLAQVSGYDFAILADGLAEPWQAVTLSKQVLTIINERLPLHGLQLRPYASVGIAMFHAGLSAEQFYRRAVSAAVTARRKGKNQIEFFDPEQMEKAQRRLMEEHDIMTALDNQQFAIWLQPQVACASGEICGAEVLLRQSQKLKKLLDDLLEASKATTGNLEVHPEVCDVSVLLSQAVGEYGQRFADKQLETIVKQPEETVKVMADGRHLWRVFDNLLNNIYKYAQTGSRVYLNVEHDSQNVRIIFRNMSAYPLEMSPEELEERFTRGDRSRHMEGNGLGLSIAKSLTELQKGDMEIVTDGDLFKVVITLPETV